MSDELAGKMVLITGGNTGIGKETAIALAGMGAQVVFTARNPQKGSDALVEIRKRSGSANVEVMALDLASLASVREFATAFAAAHDRLDVLVNNAGSVLSKRSETEDGYETTFQVNHLGHFLLTQLLQPQLTAGASARVISVSSDLHKRARHGLDFDDLQSEHEYRGVRAYGRSKLANILFTRELARRWDGTGVTANSLHPGVVSTRLGADGDMGRMASVAMVLLKPFILSPQQGAQTSIYLASSPDVEGITGAYWVKSASTTPAPAAQDDAAARR
ncbi:MAG TPA: SDR family oxidoreductase, partial [Acidimicrobiia bacterium]